MHTRSRPTRPNFPFFGRLFAALAVLIAFWMAMSGLLAGELVLKSGFRVTGTVAKMQALSLQLPPISGEFISYPILMADDGMRRYFVAERLTAEKNFDVELAQHEKFDLPQRKQGRAVAFDFDSVPPFLRDTGFNEFGHRQVAVRLPTGRPVDLTLAITQLRPQSCTVTGLNCQWEFSVATTSLPPDKLDAMLRRCTNPAKPEDRFAVVRFYQQAGLYLQAMQELDAIATDLPDQKARVDEVMLQSRQLLARRLLQELQRRRAAGQHQLAISSLKNFPTEQIGADILRELRQFQTEYTDATEKIERVKHLLGDLQAGLSREELQQVAPLRNEVIQEIDFETLPRLEPFLRLEKDATLPAAEKLALAYSAWVVGDANAVTDLVTAIRWWHARFHVLQYLRANHPRQRQQTLTDLAATEGVGAKTVEQLIPLLPPIVDTPEIEGGKILTLAVNEPGRSRDDVEANQPTFRYSVLVPQEFNPHHVYPLIVALHDGGSTPERELKWWGGDEASPSQSQRHGYVVIAPEHLPPKSGDPVIAPAETIVWECLRDARRRFLIDSDRVFLSGHGHGAEAAFDVALARPDLFAGVMPISGGLEGDAKWLKDQTEAKNENAKSQAWYVVMGEFDFGLFNNNAERLQPLMLKGCDLLVAQYKSRGRETYHSEIQRFFEWMELHRRQAEPKEFRLLSLRTTDARLNWVRWADAAPRAAHARKARSIGLPSATAVPKPIALEARVLSGQTEATQIRITGGGPLTLWLNSKLVDVDKRLHVYVGGNREFNNFLKPEVEAVLEDFRQCGDRQRLHSVRVLID